MSSLLSSFCFSSTLSFLFFLFCIVFVVKCSFIHFFLYCCKTVVYCHCSSLEHQVWLVHLFSFRSLPNCARKARFVFVEIILSFCKTRLPGISISLPSVNNLLLFSWWSIFRFMVILLHLSMYMWGSLWPVVCHKLLLTQNSLFT